MLAHSEILAPHTKLLWNTKYASKSRVIRTALSITSLNLIGVYTNLLSTHSSFGDVDQLKVLSFVLLGALKITAVHLGLDPVLR